MDKVFVFNVLIQSRSEGNMVSLRQKGHHQPIGLANLFSMSKVYSDHSCYNFQFPSKLTNIFTWTYSEIHLNTVCLRCV